MSLLAKQLPQKYFFAGAVLVTSAIYQYTNLATSLHTGSYAVSDTTLYNLSTYKALILYL